MRLFRKEAIILLSFYELLHLSEQEMAKYSENVKVERSLADDIASEKLNFYIRDYLAAGLKFYTTAYLADRLSKYLHIPIEIIGKKPKLYPCPCCGYYTFERVAEYDICEVCFWEYDGVQEPDKRSGANHISLNQAKENFEKLGVVEKRFQKFVHPDRMRQFEKGK